MSEGQKIGNIGYIKFFDKYCNLLTESSRWSKLVGRIEYYFELRGWNVIYIVSGNIFKVS